MRYKRFVTGVVVATSVSAGLFAGGNWLVDPYQIWGSSEYTGWSLDKPAVEFHQRLSEIQRALQSKPEAVVIGTSRADIGLDPKHPAFYGLQSFNLATQAQPPRESRLILEKLPGLKRVVWATDFFTYGCQHLGTIHDFSDDLFSERTRWLSLESITTVRDSILTVLGNSSPYAPWNRWRDDGFRLWTDDDGFVAVYGYRRRSLVSEKEYLEKLYGGIKAIHCSASDRSNPLKEYRQALRVAHLKHIDLRLVIGPSHARQWETLAASGLWASWETWKRLLVKINVEEAANVGLKPFPLWDFSGYNSITMEAIPSLTDKESHMHWHWDSSHYKKETGDLVLDRIFGHQQLGRSVPRDFGIMLFSVNIESHLKAIRDARVEYRKMHPEDVGEIEQMAGKLRARTLASHTD